MGEPQTAKELTKVMGTWLDKGPASDWGYFGVSLFDLLVKHGCYGNEQEFFNE